MQANQTPTKQRSGPRAARRVLAGAVVTALFTAPTVTAAFAAPTDHSEAFGQVINVDGLGLDVADAGYSYSANPSSPAAQENPLNLSALNGLLGVEVGAITLPVIGDDGTGLIQLGQAGALSSYAIADTATHAKASAGVLGGDGALAVDGNTSDLASIDLTKLFGQTGLEGVTDDILDQAELQLGALGSTTERTDGADPSHEYKIASATVDLRSPLISQLSTGLTTTTTELGAALNGIVGDGGLTDTISSSLNAVNVDLLLAEIGLSNSNLVVNGLDDVTGTLSTVLAQELVSDTGAVSLNLGEGTVNIDLSKIITGGLNDQPANTELLDDATVAKISAEITSLLDEVTTNLTDAVNEILAEATFTLTADVNAEVVLAGDLVDGGVNISGSLADLLNGNTEAFTLANTLELLPGLGGINVGSLLDSVLELVLGVTGPAFQGVNALLDGYPEAIQALVTEVAGPLIDTGIEPVLQSALSVTLNEQGTVASTDVTVPATGAAAPAAAQIVAPAPEGELNYVTALAIDVLPVLGAGAVGVDLGTSAVRAAAEAPAVAVVDILTPAEGEEVPVGDVDVTGTGEPGTEVTVSIPGQADQVTNVGEDGTWTVTFPDVPAGDHTATATDENDSTDVVNFVVVDPAADAEATDVDTEATDAVDADATDAVDADATDAVDADATDAVDADATDAVDADATDAVDADATDAVDADATDAVDADATDADATDAVDADATDADATDADATDAVDADATDADATDADATDAVDADATDADATDADATDAVDADATDAD
ncbi:choice-of-anchor G family protein, partial [Arthrobacter sp. MYb213]|uniref:choice-of-anchor G family protein n=1 Tax=Arthrobacter sp. MYb213 TaxID=1848595 RepID=UPI0011B02535